MSTITTTIGHGITLTGSYASPLTITSTGAVSGGNYNAIYGPPGVSTVVNFGTVQSGHANGIYLAGGGVITNGSAGAGTALISGQRAIRVHGGAGAVSNAGAIVGTTGGASVASIQLDAGGTVANGVSGMTAALILGDSYGVQVQTAAGTVTNAGTILAISGFSTGVQLSAGGSVANGVGGATAALIQGVQYGIRIQGVTGTVTNAGTTTATNTTGGSTGVFLAKGGYVGNGASGATSALISGFQFGVYVTGVAGIVNNSATIKGIGNVNDGVFLAAGGTVANGVSGATAALISGGNVGVQAQGAADAVTNAATIIGSGTGGTGIELDHGGNITNGIGGVTSALISGGRAGILVQGAAGTVANYGSVIATASAGKGVWFSGTYNDTLTNGGSIAGNGGGDAVLFGGGNDRLIVDPGAVFAGKVDGGAGTNTIELAVGSGAAGSLSGIGPTITNFSTLQFDGGAKWTAEGSAAGLPGAITGFAAGDTIDVDGFVAVSHSYNGSGLVLTDALSNTVTLGIQGSFTTGSGSFTILPDTHGGTDVTTNPVCFCRGTLIQTERGEVAVEALAVGDRVWTLSGASKPIVWIGMGRDLVTRRHSLARPIIVRQGALADNVPTRDLHLTHGHALYFDDVLIPVENLVNHRSILWDEAAQVVEYYHVELEDHDVLWANGAPAESYYDAGNRTLFHNTRPGSEPGAARPSFAPVLNGGAIVDQVWAALYQRAGGQIERCTTDDPDLHLVVEGRRLDATGREDRRYTFALEAPPAAALSLRSRGGVPSVLGITVHDHRRLGVAISRIELRQDGIVTRLDHDAPLFAEDGCHAAENGYRWTDGALELPAPLFAHLAGAFTLTVYTERPGMRYPMSPAVAVAA